MNTKTMNTKTMEDRITLYPFRQQNGKWVVTEGKGHIINLGRTFTSEEEALEYVRSFWSENSIFMGRDVEDEIGKGWSILDY